jgi:MoxR-like ATPase
MTYDLTEPLFETDHVAKVGSRDKNTIADLRDGSVYVYTDEIVLMINVALATGRPLLISGSAGSGKSSLARNVARLRKWHYFEEVITPRTQARDLLWRFDAVRRLRDAQAKELGPIEQYLRRGVLWEAFVADDKRSVVLLDEIDKADPDVPNSLLVALGSLEFTVEETNEPVVASASEPPLVVITTNNERELPKPFMRRCVLLALQPPDVPRLLEIADAHGLGQDEKLARSLAERVVELAAKASAAGLPEPSAAEYLDALRACRQFKISPESDAWEAIASATLIKRPDGSSARA